MFWIICIVMALVVALFIAKPLLRLDGSEVQSPDVALYRAQLAEVDRDVARDVLSIDEAETARTEISRRLLAASKHNRVEAHAPRAQSRMTAAAITVLLFGLGGVTYLKIGQPGEPDQPLAARLAQAAVMRENRPAQRALENAAPPSLPVDAPQEYLDQIAQLRAMVPTRSDDLQGWALLAYHESRLRNFSAAAAAQDRVVKLKGDDTTVEDLTLLVDLMVSAANGVVSPEAETVARAIIKRAPEDVAGRYYIGALYNQTDRPDLAFRIWRPIAESGIASFHESLVRAQIEAAAFRAGVEYNLPEVKGPDAATIAASEDMTDEDRQAMIGGMVNQLADRLATQGGPPGDWARLIGAYGVLGETDAAATIWLEAQGVFADDPVAMDALRAAAIQAGVAE